MCRLQDRYNAWPFPKHLASWGTGFPRLASEVFFCNLPPDRLRFCFLHRVPKGCGGFARRRRHSPRLCCTRERRMKYRLAGLRFGTGPLQARSVLVAHPAQTSVHDMYSMYSPPKSSHNSCCLHRRHLAPVGAAASAAKLPSRPAGSLSVGKMRQTPVLDPGRVRRACQAPACWQASAGGMNVTSSKPGIRKSWHEPRIAISQKALSPK